MRLFLFPPKSGVMQANKEVLRNVKTSYFRILTYFLSNETVQSAHVRCLLRWGLQLQLNQEDISAAFVNGSFNEKLQDLSKLEKLEAIYHLVFLINQDTVVEDVELEVASIYARHLGFPETVLSDLFRSVATASDDGLDTRDWKTQVADFLAVYKL